MTDSEGADFVRVLLRNNRVIRIATIGPTGAPTVVPVWFGFGGDRIAVTMPTGATVRNIERSAEATVLVDEGSGYADLRGAVIETTARAYPAESAPRRVRQLVEAADQKYADELAEARAVRAIDFDGRELSHKSRYRLELEIRRARWFVLGGSITGRVPFETNAIDNPEDADE